MLSHLWGISLVANATDDGFVAAQCHWPITHEKNVHEIAESLWQKSSTFAYLRPILTPYHDYSAGEVVELQFVGHSISSTAVYCDHLFLALYLVWPLQVQALLEERAMWYASDDPLADGLERHRLFRVRPFDMPTEQDRTKKSPSKDLAFVIKLLIILNTTITHLLPWGCKGDDGLW